MNCSKETHELLLEVFHFLTEGHILTVIGCTIFPRYVMWTLIGGFSCQSREHVGHWLSGSSFDPEMQRGLEKVKTSHSDCTAQNWE